MAIRFNKKAQVSVMTGFFIVLVIVFAIIGITAFYYSLMVFGTETGENVDLMLSARLFKDRFLTCQEKNFLSETKLTEESCTDLTGVKGYRVVQKEYYDCDAKKWEYGAADDFDSLRYVYLVTVQQQNGQKCIAQLFIYQ